MVTGTGFTVTVATAVLIQPFASVPVTVYVVVAAGAAVTDAPVAGVVPADHEYAEAPAAFKVAVVCPSQIAVELTVTTGNGFTTTLSVPVPTHPFASVTEILYVPAAAVVTAEILGF